MKRLFMMSVSAALLFAVTNQSMAVCRSEWAKVNYIDRQSNGNVRVFVEQHSHSGNGMLWWYNTKDPQIIALASAALNDGTTVWVTGNAEFCISFRASSSFTPGYGGVITKFEVFRNR